MDFISLIAMILVLVGVHLIAIPKVSGQYVMFFAQAVWLLYAALNTNTFLFFQSAYLLILSIVAILSWNKKGVG